MLNDNANDKVLSSSFNRHKVLRYVVCITAEGYGVSNTMVVFRRVIYACKGRVVLCCAAARVTWWLHVLPFLKVEAWMLFRNERLIGCFAWKAWLRLRAFCEAHSSLLSRFATTFPTMSPLCFVSEISDARSYETSRWRIVQYAGSKCWAIPEAWADYGAPLLQHHRVTTVGILRGMETTKLQLSDLPLNW